MTTPKPQTEVLDFNERTLSFKCYLKAHAFSKRCKNHYRMKCPYLLTIPITEENYTTDEWRCIGVSGASQTSVKGHSDACNKGFFQKRNKEHNSGTFCSQQAQVSVSETFSEWQTDLNTLRTYIKSHLSEISSSIETAMKAIKQNFSLKVIKEERRKVLDELYPKDTRIAFHPTNCYIVNKRKEKF